MPAELAEDSGRDVGFETVAAEFRRRRAEAGLVQEAVRRGSGLSSQNLLSMLERGIIEKPAMEDLCKLGTFFKMSPNEIARLAGWWQPDEASSESEIDELRRDLEGLTPDERRELVDVLRRLALGTKLSRLRRAPDRA